MSHHITKEVIARFKERLYFEERESGTIDKYLRDVRAFGVWLGNRPVAKETAALWKEHLLEQGYAPVTINSMLAALNRLFAIAGWDECRVKALRIQRRLFRDQSQELTREEYGCLVDTALALGRERLALLMETICATGIRVSEVQYITVEAAQRGRADLSLKGKIRTILIPQKLARKLLKYAKKKKTVSGAIFRTRNGNLLSRKQIWAEMKALCQKAGVSESKVFPHNLRHLFAQTFYKATRDVARLADVLGHSSIETTRIYLISTGAEHVKQMERLDLIS